MKTYFQRGRLLAPGFFLVASVVIDAGEPSTRLFLSPDSPALSEVSVPLLHEEVPEHRLSGGGLSLLPETGPYEWTKVGPTRDIFRLKLRVEADQFAYAVLTVWNWQNFPVQQIRIEAGKEELLEIEISALGTYLLTLAKELEEGGVFCRDLRFSGALPLETRRDSDSADWAE